MEMMQLLRSRRSKSVAVPAKTTWWWRKCWNWRRTWNWNCKLITIMSGRPFSTLIRTTMGILLQRSWPRFFNMECSKLTQASKTRIWITHLWSTWSRWGVSRVILSYRIISFASGSGHPSSRLRDSISDMTLRKIHSMISIWKSSLIQLSELRKACEGF